MDTKKLRQFCTIVELGSLTKAAKLLHITHSGLSKAMKLLQDELGLVLFRPAGRGLALTEDGILIYGRAKEFLEQEERLFKLEKNQLPSTLSIGATEIFLLSMSERLRQQPFSHHTLTLLDLDPGNMEQLIANRQIDFGITYVPYPMRTLEMTEIGTYRLGCYHLKGAFQGKKISEIPFVVPAKGLSSNTLGIRERDGWLESIYPRQRKYSVNLLSTAIDLTLQGLCAVYMPDFVAKSINASRKSKEILIEHPLPTHQKNTQSAFLFRHKDQLEDTTFKQLCRIVKEMISNKA